MGQVPVLDQVGFAGREDESAAGDIDLAAAEIDRVKAARDGADNLVASATAGQHESVGHARHRDVGEALAPPVAGGLHAHQPRVEAVLQIAAQDAAFDQYVVPRRSALVVNV